MYEKLENINYLGTLNEIGHDHFTLGDKGDCLPKSINDFKVHIEKKSNEGLILPLRKYTKKLQTFSNTETAMASNNKFSFFAANNSKGEINSLFISTTYIDIKEKEAANSIEILSELESMGLIFLKKNPTTNHIDSIETNSNCDILKLKQMESFNYDKIGFGNQASEFKTDEDFLKLVETVGVEYILKSYVKNIFQPDAKIEINENNLISVLNKTRFRTNINSSKIISNSKKLKMEQ